MALTPSRRSGAGDRVIDVGRCAGGTRFVLPAPGHGLVHLLNSGKTDSGKSSTVARIAGVLCGRAEVAFLGVDHKGGLELLPFEPRFTEVATSTGHTEDLLGRTVELVDIRGQVIRATGEALGRTIRSWESWMGPRLVAVVDEGAEVARSKTAIELLDSLAARGRALGVHVVVSTQYGLTSDFPTTLLLNLAGRICHRMGTATQYATALAVDQAELRTHGFEPIPEGNRHRGVCYVNGIPGMVDLSRCRADLVTDTALDRQVARTAHLRWPPELIFNPPSIDELVGGVTAGRAEADGDPQGSRRSEAPTQPTSTTDPTPAARPVVFGGLTHAAR
jgi:S-DNA-T family DNA segregation ATPase FtsK/SpoIIIE